MIRYLGNEKDGYPAMEQANAITDPQGGKVRARLLYLAQRLADHGKLIGEHGHWLEDPFSEVYEFKPHAYRALAFRDGKTMLITSVVAKAKPKIQSRDYKTADAARITHFDAG